MAEFTLTSDGNTDSFEPNTTRVNVSVYGTFGSGTLKAEYSVDNGNSYIDIADTAITTNSGYNLTLPIKVKLRFNLTSSTSPNITIKTFNV